MTNSEKNTATLIHLSTLTQYFIPFGNYIFPAIFWSSKKDDSAFIDFHGKQTLNFQLSMFLYNLLLILIAVPIFIYTILNSITTESFNNDSFILENLSKGNISTLVLLAIVCVVVFFFLKIMEFFLIIYAAVKASNGESYQYPLTINFLK